VPANLVAAHDMDLTRVGKCCLPRHDYALRALAHLRHDFGRDDLHSIFMGSGDRFDEMVALIHELGLGDCVEFTGRVPDEFVQRCLSTADVCLSPDPRNPLNDAATMNKVVEYMAMGRPARPTPHHSRDTPHYHRRPSRPGPGSVDLLPSGGGMSVKMGGHDGQQPHGRADRAAARGGVGDEHARRRRAPRSR
jgi:hypothetical protein